MRFPKLSRFFHKRSKSDTVLSGRPDPVSTLLPRPVSVSLPSGNMLVLPAGSSDSTFCSEVFALVPDVPILLPIGLQQESCDSAAAPCIEPTQTAVTPFQDTIGHLDMYGGYMPQQFDEKSMNGQQDYCALTRSFNSSIARLPWDQPQGTEDHSNLVEQIESLRAENARLNGLVELLKPLRGVQTVFDVAHRHIVYGGMSAEDALVDAIRYAMAQPGSPWRRLQEPVIGKRSPEDYLAQVNCTLQARREGLDWRKRARFWKNAAKEYGRHMETITPSASQLSEVVEELSLERKAAVDRLRKQRESLGYPTRTKLSVTSSCISESAEDVPAMNAMIQKNEELDSHPRAQEHEAVIKEQESQAGLQHSTILEEVRPDLPASDTVKQEPITLPPYMNLPRLASVSFRESHSITSVPSKKDSLKGLVSLSASMSAQAILSGRFEKHQVRSLANVTTSSTERSTMPSPAVSTLGTVFAQPHSSVSDRKRDSISSGLHLVSSSLSRILLALGSGYFKTPFMSDSENKPPVHEKSLQESTLIASLGVYEDEKMVSKTPSSDATPTNSPAKKSRLPIPVSMHKVKNSLATPRLIKRLSISRPILVDTTNAAIQVQRSSPKADIHGQLRKKVGMSSNVGVKPPKAVPPKKDSGFRRVGDASPEKAAVTLRQGEGRFNSPQKGMRRSRRL